MSKGKKSALLLLACYLLVLVGWLVLATVALVGDNVRRTNGTLVYTPLALEGLELEGVRVLGEDSFVSSDSDPQLVYRRGDGAAFAPGVVRFAGVNNRPTGEIVLYYTTRAGEDFSDSKRLWAQRDADGWWFDLSGKRVVALRLDPDSVAEGVVWQLDEFSYGNTKPAYRYFLPDARGWLVLLALPLLLWALLRTCTAPILFALAPLLKKWARKRETKKEES